MKKLKIIIPAVAILAVAGCVTAFAVVGKNFINVTDDSSNIENIAPRERKLELPKTEENQDAEIEQKEQETKTAEQKENETPSGKLALNGSRLIYKETYTYGGAVTVDKYEDSNKNIYEYDKQGHFIGFKMNDEAYSNEVSGTANGSSVTEEDAKTIAWNFSKKLFGSVVDGFSFKTVIFDQSSNEYVVFFSKKYGENDFISAESCSVGVMKSGNPSNAYLTNVYEFSDFDRKLVDGMKAESLNKFTEEQLAALFPSGVKSYVTEAYSLVKKNGKYYISINVVAEPNNGWTEGAKTPKEIFYPLG